MPDADFEPHAAGRAKRATFRFDSPAFVDQGVDDSWKLLGGYAEQLPRFEVTPGVAKSKLVQTIDRRLFRLAIATNEPPMAGIVGRRGRRTFDHGTVIVKLHCRAKILTQGVRVLSFRTRHADAWTRRPLNDVVAKLGTSRQRDLYHCASSDQRCRLRTGIAIGPKLRSCAIEGNAAPTSRRASAVCVNRNPRLNSSTGSRRSSRWPSRTKLPSIRIGSVPFSVAIWKVESPRRTVVPDKPEKALLVTMDRGRRGRIRPRRGRTTSSSGPLRV